MTTLETLVAQAVRDHVRPNLEYFNLHVPTDDELAAIVASVRATPPEPARAQKGDEPLGYIPLSSVEALRIAPHASICCISKNPIPPIVASVAVFLHPAATPTEKASTAPVKDHVIREVVNSLRDIARTFHGHQQLRERIAYAIEPLLGEKASTESVGDRLTMSKFATKADYERAVAARASAAKEG